MILCLTACSSKTSEISKKENKEKNDVKKNSNKQEFEIKDISFNKNIIVEEDDILYIKPDGSVWGKGKNEEGKLGNGRRDKTLEWTQVHNIKNAVSIVPINGVLALDSSGDIWNWGANILEPQVVAHIDNAESMKKEGNYAFIKCSDGKKYVVTRDYHSNIIFVPFSSDISQVQNYTIIRKDNSTILSDNFFSIKQDMSKYEVLETTIEELNPDYSKLVNLNKSIYPKKIGDSNSFVSTDGLVYLINRKENQQTSKIDYSITHITDFDNIDIVQQDSYFNDARGRYNVFYLKADGSMYTTGYNEDGQLGDGTNNTLSMKDGYYKITESLFKEYISDNRSTIWAIDFDNNLWAWGEGYTSIPKIILSADEINNVSFSVAESNYEMGDMSYSGTYSGNKNTSGEIAIYSAPSDSEIIGNATFVIEDITYFGKIMKMEKTIIRY